MPHNPEEHGTIATRSLPALRTPADSAAAAAGAAGAVAAGGGERLERNERWQQQEGSPLQRPASAWLGALQEASLARGLSSPLASTAYSRSFSAGFRPADAWGAHLVVPAAEAADSDNAKRWAGIKQEARNLSCLALPTSLTNLGGCLIGLITLGFAGRLGSFELSCMVLGTSIFNVTGLSLLMGFAAAMETFCGQAYGARNYRMVGVVYQRALLLTTVLAALVAAVWLQAESLLILFRQDPLLSRSAARYIRLTIPALWATGVFEASKRYLMAQGVVRPQSAITLVGLALAPLYSWLFIFHLDWRLDGAAYAVDAIQVTMAALLGLYIMARDAGVLRGLPHATWHGWSVEPLRGWPTYLWFALPSVVMICAEWSTFEIMILMSGVLANPAVSVAVMGICINTSGIIWMVVTGYAMACSTRVSNSLGAGCPRTARRATWTAVGITTCMELAAMLAILLLRHHWAFLFTGAREVHELTASLLPIFALSLPGDGANATLQGLLRGSGRQETGAITNLCSYWLLGIPAAAYLAFTKQLGVHGLWWGLVLVNTVQGTLMAIIACRFDFEKEARKAAARTAAARQLTGTVVDGEGGAGLAEPLLQGPQCERLESGLLLGPEGEVPAPAGAEDGPAVPAPG